MDIDTFVLKRLISGEVYSINAVLNTRQTDEASALAPDQIHYNVDCPNY
jgi:hypothetical protein